MQTKYRSIPCPGCGKTLRITVKSDERLGKPIRLTCTTCWNEFETIFPVSEIPPSTTTDQNDVDETADMTEKDVAIVGPLVEELGSSLYEAVATNSELSHIVKKFRAAGYNPALMLAAMIGVSKIGSPLREPVPLVKDGDVVPDAFTVDDGAWLKKYRINLDPEE
jgi:hypothetical protein